MVTAKRSRDADDSQNTVQMNARTGRLSKGDFIRSCVNMAVFEKVPYFNSSSFRILTAIHTFHNDVTINSQKVEDFVQQAAQAVREKIRAEGEQKVIH